MKAFDNTARAWRLRDREFLRLVERLSAATTWEEMHHLTSAAFGLIWLATQAGEGRRAKTWTVELGTAVDDHALKRGPG